MVCVGQFVEIVGVGFQCVGWCVFCVVVYFFVLFCCWVVVFYLGNIVGDEIDYVQMVYVLVVEQVNCLVFLFVEDCYQYVGVGDFFIV